MSAVRFYTRNAEGERLPIGGLNDLTAQLSSGALRADSELYDELLQRWGYVRDHDVYISLKHAGGNASLRRPFERILALPGLRLILAAFLVLIAVLVVSPTGYAASDIGYALGSSVLGAALSWPLLRETSKRRGLGVVVFLGTGLLSLISGAVQDSSRRRAKVSQSLAELRSAIDSSSTAPNGIPPASVDAEDQSPVRLAKRSQSPLVSRSDASELQQVLAVMKDVRVAIETFGKTVAITKFGVDIDTPPPEWLEAAYIANASRYPHVGEYWKRYGEYLEYWSRNGGRLTDSILSVAVNRTGVSESFSVEVRKGAAASFSKDLPAYAIASRTVRTALSLHRTLVAYDQELSLSPDGQQWVYLTEDTNNAIQRRLALMTAQGDSMTSAFAARQADRVQQLNALEKAIR